MPVSKTPLRRTYLSAENRKARDSKEEEKLLNCAAFTACRNVLFTDFFASATVGFRTIFLSLTDFKSDLSRTKLKLSSSATWPLFKIGMLIHFNARGSFKNSQPFCRAVSNRQICSRGQGVLSENCISIVPQIRMFVMTLSFT